MALERYRQKRDFRMTPEPAGKVGQRRARGLKFVIQKHAASRLHYDFRLELDGVLLSWAVPKGPSLDPNDKRLAMHVEDHPLEYGDFEGVIPPKQYGAGTVMVWDRGTWLPKTDPAEAYAKGRLKFDLDGEKLQGGWNLVRSRSGKYGGENSWLLFKEADEFARLGPQALIGEDRPDSVVTGRTLQQIAADADRVWHSNKSVADNVKGGAIRKSRASAAALAKIHGARKAPLPDLLEAQLATSAKAPPTGPAWVHEIKYDGYRMLCRIARQQVRMVSRNDKDWTGDFPALARALALLPVDDAWLDGEVVALDAHGRTSFQALQKALSAKDSHDLKYLAFDLLYLNGFDLRGVVLTERKRLLRDLLSSAPERSSTASISPRREPRSSERRQPRARRHGVQARRPAVSRRPRFGLAKNQVHAAAGNGGRRLHRSGRVSRGIRRIAARRLRTRRQARLFRQGRNRIQRRHAGVIERHAIPVAAEGESVQQPAASARKDAGRTG